MPPALRLALRLADGGFCGGDPQAVLRKPTDVVLAMAEYLTFKNDYEMTYSHLNRKDPSA